MIDPNKIRERAIGSMYERKFCELADEWKPIGTAPKDGNRILLYQPTEGGEYNPNSEEFDTDDYYFVGWYDKGREEWYSCTYSASETSPTHWMPLPEAPNAELTGAAQHKKET